MDKLLALLAFLASLAGCDPQASRFVHRESRDGRDLLHARATLEAGVLRLECLHSTTGRCHWTSRPARCTRSSSEDCVPARLAVGEHESRQVTGVAALQLCVADREAGRPACGVLRVDEWPTPAALAWPGVARR